jgi:ADP-ribosylglycohydrolase
LERGNLELDALSHTFASRHIFGIGHAMSDFVSGMKRDEGWRRAAARSAGNGALMRIASAVLPHLTNPTSALWSDAALLARLSHDNDSSPERRTSDRHPSQQLQADSMPAGPDSMVEPVLCYSPAKDWLALGGLCAALS